MEDSRSSSGADGSTAGTLHATVAALLDLLFPWTCVACGCEAKAPLCRNCLAEVPWIGEPACERCGTPDRVATCGPCRLHPPVFGRARAVAAYGDAGGRSDPLGEALRAFKYGRRRALGAPLGRLLARRQPYLPGEHDLAIPVPLHLRRLRERGFNQAVLLARPVARRLGIPVALDVLVRIRPTPPQVSLDESERRRNVRAAFHVRRPDRVDDRRILLVDDVLTSGATADACARALLGAGARAVDVLGLARTRHPGAR